jgi:hypothetical protein
MSRACGKWVHLGGRCGLCRRMELSGVDTSTCRSNFQTFKVSKFETCNKMPLGVPQNARAAQQHPITRGHSAMFKSSLRHRCHSSSRSRFPPLSRSIEHTCTQTRIQPTASADLALVLSHQYTRSKARPQPAEEQTVRLVAHRSDSCFSFSRLHESPISQPAGYGPSYC